MKILLRVATLSMLAAFVTGCSPEVGSNKWCDKMDDTPKGEWTSNDVKSYTESCVFRKKD